MIVLNSLNSSCHRLALFKYRSTFGFIIFLHFFGYSELTLSSKPEVIGVRAPLRQVVVREQLVLRDPIPHRFESLRDELVAALATMPLLCQEPGLEQDAEMLGDRRAAHFEVRSYVGDRAPGFSKKIEYLSSRPMADRCEDIGLALGSKNHKPNICKQSLTCQLSIRYQMFLNFRIKHPFRRPLRRR